MIGIYKITNTNNGKVYIGQTNNIEVRKEQHFSALVAGKHENKLMQKDFNLTPHGWTFEVLKECPLVLLNSEERYWINFYHSDNAEYGYNLTKGGGSRKRKFKGRPASLLDELTG